jgi:heme/copper-type cytochrome/quinol oxidase subunit 4
MAMTEALEQQRGLVAIVVLAVLTLVEYLVAIGLDSTTVVITLLAVFAIAKALVILEYFMHLSRVWRGEGDHA